MESSSIVERHVGTKANSALLGSDPPDVVPDQLGEPDLLAATACDAERQASARGNRELGDDPAGGDPPDVVPVRLGEPQVAVGTSRDALRHAAGRGKREPGDNAAGADPSGL